MKCKKIIIAACMIASAAAISACGGNKEEAQGDSKTLSYWVGMDSNIAARIQTYNDMAMYKQREKDSGIHIEFIHPAVGQDGEQFNLLVASRDYPDMIEYSWANYKGGPQNAIDENIIIALNDYLDKAPNFKKALTDKNEFSATYKKSSMTDGGNYYGFTTLNVGNYRIFGGPCIRRDWLEELGLPMPETIDDWTTVLRAFKEKKNATAPLTGTIGNLCNSSVSTFAGAFGVSNRIYLEDGKVKFGPVEPGYKEFVTVMNQWYSEGLIDKDLATNKGTLVDAKITGGESGALVSGYLGSALGRYLKQKETEDPSYDLVGTAYPVKNRGDKNKYPLMEQDVMSTRTLAITTACKNPQMAVEWADYWYSDEGYKLLNFGIEGESYTVVDGKPVYTDKILNNPDGLSVNESLLMNCRATEPAPGFKQAPEYLEQYYEYPQQVESFKKWAEIVDLGREGCIPVVSPTAEETDIISGIETELNTYVNEMVWKFIIGKEPLENYDAFVSNLKSNFRIDEYIAIKEAQIERYNLRK